MNLNKCQKCGRKVDAETRVVRSGVGVFCTGCVEFSEHLAAIERSAMFLNSSGFSRDLTPKKIPQTQAATA
jgi:hypothetical protein